MAIDLDVLIADQTTMLEGIEPVEVPVMLGGNPVTVRIPFLMPASFSELAASFPPRPNVPADLSLWFSLEGVTRAYPDIVLLDGDDEDDLLVIREKQIVYRWAEVYDVLAPEDQSNVRAAIWGLHVYEPEQRRRTAVKGGRDG